MDFIKNIFYSITSPVLRTILGNSITSKPVAGTSFMLSYQRSQHLNFLFKKEIDYEKEFRSEFLKHIDEGDLVFEIGSNIGQHSLLIAAKAGPKGKLVCIEPDSGNYSFLSSNIQKNQQKNVELIQAAVSNNAGSSVFYKDTVTGGRMSSLIKNYAADKFEGITEEVRLVTLQELIKSYGIPDFIKVDVEGAEDLVFSDPAILNPKTTYLVEVRRETGNYIYHFFADHGFSIFQVDDHMKPVKTKSEMPNFGNLLIMNTQHHDIKP